MPGSEWRHSLTGLCYFLDSRKKGERRGSSSSDSQKGNVITFFECLSNQITIVISLKMYKNPSCLQENNVQLSFPPETNINSEEQKIEWNEPGYCKAVGLSPCNCRHCCKSWNIKSHWVERWMQSKGNLEGNKTELMKVCSLSSM